MEKKLLVPLRIKIVFWYR